ncbi:hypothetical protein [Plantactinospora sonchi]|uniref:YbaB/EbfC family DNA-binding protein n=1 Tax=Plantactinospora sonchi TaxID=1544735 RepID=A0ABU7RL31_9ACTN
MRDDDVDLAGLRELQREIQEVAAQLSAAASAAEAEFVGGDSTGAVEVTIDSSGAPARVRLDRDWLRLVGTAGLGPAVIEAGQAAATEQMTAWAVSASEAASAPPVPFESADLVEVERAEFGDPSSRQSAYAIRDLFDLADGILDRLDDLQQAAQSAAERRLTSTNLAHTVRVSAVGGKAETIEFDDQWLRSAHSERIADAIQEALMASWRVATEERQRLDESVPGIERMRRLTASPETLLREIGFIR